MVLTNSEKAYIAQRMLSSNPANGLSASDFRRKVGVRVADSKTTLADEVTRLMGGLSESEAAKILSTNPYMNVDPANLVLGKSLIDRSETNAALLKVTRRPGNRQAPRVDRELPMEGFLDPSSAEYRSQNPFEDYDGDFYQGNFLPKLKKAKAGKVTKPRTKSEWNKFVQKVSKWPSLSTMGVNKMKALSLLYAEASTGDIREFIQLEFMDPADMRKRLDL